MGFNTSKEGGEEVTWNAKSLHKEVRGDDHGQDESLVGLPVPVAQEGDFRRGRSGEGSAFLHLRRA